jgi:hypothetical protein
MKPKIATLLIYGPSEDIFQSVKVSYIIEIRGGFFDEMWVAVTECKILDDVIIEPSDLETDLCEGIRFNECINLRVGVKIECEVDTKITAEENF